MLGLNLTHHLQPSITYTQFQIPGRLKSSRTSKRNSSLQKVELYKIIHFSFPQTLRNVMSKRGYIDVSRLAL